MGLDCIIDAYMYVSGNSFLRVAGVGNDGGLGWGLGLGWGWRWDVMGELTSPGAGNIHGGENGGSWLSFLSHVHM